METFEEHAKLFAGTLKRVFPDTHPETYEDGDAWGFDCEGFSIWYDPVVDPRFIVLRIVRDAGSDVEPPSYDAMDIESYMHFKAALSRVVEEIASQRYCDAVFATYEEIENEKCAKGHEE